MVLICVDCGYFAKLRKDGKYECDNNSTGGCCKNNCLSAGTPESNKLNGFTIIY